MGAGQLSTAIINSQLIKLMTTWGVHTPFLRSVIGDPLSDTSMLTTGLGIKPEPLAANTTLFHQLSLVLQGEAQHYWNRILTWAHMAQFYACFQEEVKVRHESR